MQTKEHTDKMTFHATFMTYGFTPVDEPSEAIGRITYIEGIGEVYHHNVAQYRHAPKWRKISRQEFHRLMETTQP